ncbi:unnamed protein product [Rangifer tarandus platyrhynchus]|uniref:Uncharacterized protein n=2 Tax=Rangifer tarandus platyrhynchus TaxID=3082113 RepID=A0ABN8ZHZ7_RANTA|nr:unnamed protein product [Rangifer tarandus platyrhynchus]CAI9707607.1 unnamed protein product [Rangifer tarandus platyrhynchus]
MWASGQRPAAELRCSDGAPVPPSTRLSPACAGEVSPQPAPASGAECPARGPSVAPARHDQRPAQEPSPVPLAAPQHPAGGSQSPSPYQPLRPPLLPLLMPPSVAWPCLLVPVA